MAQDIYDIAEKDLPRDEDETTDMMDEESYVSKLLISRSSSFILLKY